MNVTVATWPFVASHQRSIEESERWWNECYLHRPINDVLYGQTHWRLISGSAGSGCTVALESIRRRSHRDNPLTLDYFSSRWPGGKLALYKDGNHLCQIMALASHMLRQILGDKHPIANLPQTDREFLRWLIEKFSGLRAYTRWLEDIPVESRMAMETIEFCELFSTQTDYLDVQGQVEELVRLSLHLGFSEVMVYIDVDKALLPAEANILSQLFEWLELMHHPKFTIITAIPLTLQRQLNLITLARGRVNFTELHWSREDVREVARLHIVAATDTRIERLDQLIAPDALCRLEQMIETEYGEITPRAWIGLSQILLQFAQTIGNPLPVGKLPEIERLYYQSFFKLRMVPKSSPRGVWRGPRFIPIDESPFLFLEALYIKNGLPLEPDEFRQFGNAANAHTLARRLRQSIEPDPSQPIYVKSHRGEGYWLDAFDLL